MVTIDLEVLDTLIQAARSELDRQRAHPGRDRGQDPELDLLAAAVEHAGDLIDAAMLLEWQALRAELRRRASQSPPHGALDHRRP